MRYESSSLREYILKQGLIPSRITSVYPSTKYCYRISIFCKRDIMPHRVYSCRTTTHDSYSCPYDIGEYFLEYALRIGSMFARPDDSDKSWELFMEFTTYIEKKWSMTYSFQSFRIFSIIESYYRYRLIYEEFFYFFCLYSFCFYIYLLLSLWSDTLVDRSCESIIPEFICTRNI